MCPCLCTIVAHLMERECQSSWLQNASYILFSIMVNSVPVSKPKPFSLTARLRYLLLFPAVRVNICTIACEDVGLNVDGEAGWTGRGAKGKGGQKKGGKGEGRKGKASPAEIMAAKTKGKARKKNK